MMSRSRFSASGATSRRSTTSTGPLWENLTKETDGRISVKYVTLNEAGIKGGQALRFLKKGAFDIMTISVSYVSGDEPSLVAIDLPGVAFDFETLKKMSDAYRPVMAERLAKFNGVLLTHWPFNPQIVFLQGRDQVARRPRRQEGPCQRRAGVRYPRADQRHRRQHDRR